MPHGSRWLEAVSRSAPIPTKARQNTAPEEHSGAAKSLLVEIVTGAERPGHLVIGKVRIRSECEIVGEVIASADAVRRIVPGIIEIQVADATGQFQLGSDSPAQRRAQSVAIVIGAGTACGCLHVQIGERTDDIER